ncbi:hypothetical protein BFJ63_vAg991 [Fusarium oxysporum f. sp. narcissi]|uniref:Uncharacterized protein n=2 Tax=Fusarium oxysporum TaxID=5507 RepID=A0A4Q2W829_FUSOX|nr:hypothetical protein BFJ65_g12624 [Fusarium oxysporum f. sp. cepae]RKK60630.1 hypothetical protein BFJ66_g1650 [Fusarium oxysporum f. sp. cepae]RYC96117.1 hypothetical protein BFJ63_vAg991 [Fusarium oxysporum f. sp. narcissi]
MGDLNSSTFTQPWNVSIVNYNGTDHLWSKFAPPWVGTPNVRGTFDILESCIFTLIACVFTALHLDIIPNPTWQRLLLEKIKWVLLTIVVPEISLLTASNQIGCAWALKSKLKKIQKQQKSSISSPEADFEINLKYAYFIVMGGLRFDVNDILSIPDLDPSAEKLFKDPEPQNGRKPVRKAVRAGPPAIVALANKGHWIKVLEKDIDDKSKAGIFQKALVLIQVLWMIMQCVCRFVFGLPLTLLEIHTMLHVIFAIIQYCYWIKKPLDVQEPIVVQPHGFEAELAIMLQKQFYSRMSYSLALFPSRQTPEQPPPQGPLGSQMRWIDQAASAEMKVGDVLPSGLALYRSDVLDALFPLEHIWGGQTLVKHKIGSRPKYVKHSFPLTTEFLRRWDIILSKYPNEQRENLAETSMRIRQHRCDEDGILDVPEREKRILLLVRLDEFRQELQLNCERYFWEGRSFFSLDLAPHFETQGSLSKYRPMWKFWRYDKITLIAAGLSMCYGGIHLIPTFLLTFPSYTEALLWELSCLIIVGALPLYVIISGLIWLSIWCLFLTKSNVLVFPQRTPESLKRFIRTFAKYYCIYLLSVLGTAYVLSRAFIVAEIFASLRHCPVGVFITFQWLQLFPHF